MNNATPANDVTDTAAAFARENARLASRAKVAGAKYDASLSKAEIAARIRADIKAAQKAGDLPAMTVSVRCRTATYSKAIDIRITAWSGPICSTKRVREDMTGAYTHTPMYSRAALALLDSVKAIADAYNYDRSDMQTDYFDVNFYLSVDFSYDLRDASQKATEATVRAAYGAAS